MAGPHKKRAVEENPDQPNSDNGSENMNVDNTLHVDFEGRNPEASDYHGIQQLLKQLFLKAHINLGQLCDMIIAQKGLGSVLKQSVDDDDDDDEENPDGVFGINTFLNLTAHKENECVQQLLNIVDELAKKHADETVQQQFENVLSDSNKKIGLLINERFINIPKKIADPLMHILYLEIDRIAKKNPSYKFDYFLMICKTHKQLSKDKKDEGTIFINNEEELFANACDFSFEFSVANETDTGVAGLWTEDDKQMIPQRRILIIRGDKFPNIVQNVRSFVA